MITDINYKMVSEPIKKRGRPKNVVKPVASNDYFTITELADVLKLSVSHIYTMTSKKKIPHIKLLGRKLLFDKQEIKQWLKSKSVSVK